MDMDSVFSSVVFVSMTISVTVTAVEPGERSSVGGSSIAPCGGVAAVVLKVVLVESGSGQGAEGGMGLETAKNFVSKNMCGPMQMV